MGNGRGFFFAFSPVFVAAIGLAFFVSASPTYAQVYKAGEEVAVMFLGEWRPGVVVEANAKGVGVEYEFAGGTQKKVFPRNEVMYRFEVDAIYRVREWSDASGKFKIRAALMEIGDTKIRLKKPDLSELEIEIAKLGDSDKAFLADLQKKMKKNRIVLPVGPPETFDESSGVSGAMGGPGESRIALTADPLPAFLKLKSGGVVFPRQHDADRLGTLLALGGSDRYLLAAIVNDRNDANISTKIVWASLEQKKVVGEHQLPAGEIVLDYHAPSHRLLTYWSNKRGGGARAALTVWEVLPTDEEPKKVVRWFSSVTDNRGLQDLWARFADKNTVIEKADRQAFVAWDLEKKEVRYRLSQEAFFAAQPVMSPGRKLLVIPEDKQVRIYDSVAGELVSTIPTGDHAAGVAVSEDGAKLAVLQRNSLAIWSLVSGDEAPKVFQAEAIGTPFTATLAWVDADHIMVSAAFRDLVLFSLKTKISLWNYQFDHRTISETWAHRVKDIVNGHLVYAAQVDDSGKTMMVVGAVGLPGPQVYAKEEGLDRDSLLLIKAGSAVRVEVNAGSDSMAIGKRLEQKLYANGWKIDGNAKITVKAEMRIGEEQSTTYRSTFGGGEQTVRIRPHISSITIEVDGKTAWQAGTATGAPMMMMLREGQTAQSEADKWNQPNRGFFDAVEIPQEILDPKYKTGLGSTDVTVRGLIPKS